MHKIICIKLQKVWAICSVFVYLNQGHVQVHTGAQRFATVSGLNDMFPGNGVFIETYQHDNDEFVSKCN